MKARVAPLLKTLLMKTLLVKTRWRTGVKAFALALGWGLMGCMSSAAWAASVDASALAQTEEIRFLGEAAAPLRERAQSLGSAVMIYEYLRNESEYALYHGARSSAVNTLLGRRGNDVDLASTLIAMLRSQGIPSVYAVGQVRLPAAALMNWLGLRDVDLAVSVLEDQGIQGVSKSAADDTVTFEHVWVRALVGHRHYRGAGPVAVDCAPDPPSCVWVDLDPSFKLRQAVPSRIDLYEAVRFDETAYFGAIANADPAYLDKSPLEIYEEQVLAYLRAQHPGKSIADVIGKGAIIEERAGLLPASLPYAVEGAVATYASVAAHDGAVSPKWGKQVTLSLDFGTGIMFRAPPVSLAALTTQRLTLTYELGTPERLVLRLGGEDLYVPLTVGSLTLNGQVVDEGYPFAMTLTLDGAPGTRAGDADRQITVRYEQLVVGGYYLIGTGGDSSNYSQVHRAAGQLLAANEHYPIVNDADAVPYVDSNSNGQVDAGERRLLDHPAAQDALTGGLLYTAMSLYFARFREAVERLEGLNHVVTPIEGFIGVVSAVHEVEYLDDTAFSVMPGGLLIDMKGQQFAGVWRDGATAQYANRHFELLGAVTSSLEHEIWQELTGFDAVSTLRGTQLAQAAGASVLKVQASSLDAAYTAIGFSDTAPAPWQMHRRELYGTRPVSWSHPSPHQSLHLLKRAVAVNTPALRRALVTYTYTTPASAQDAWLGCVDNIENQLRDLLVRFGNVSLNPFTYCEGSVLSGPIQTVLTQTESLYRTVIVPTYLGANYLALFDETQGFEPSAYVYREALVPADHHPASRVQSMRDQLSLITSNHRREWVLPSRRTVGELYRFTVYVDKIHDGVTGDLTSVSFQIANESLSAGGGYVDGAQVLDPAQAGAVFDNAVFTDRTLTAHINNDRIITPSTVDPVSTVTGNLYHDETDVWIKGRGLPLALTRTYNARPSRVEGVAGVLGLNWTHSYNLRLRANDYGAHPNTPVSEAPANGDGVSSSITYVDERGGEHNYVLSDEGNGRLTAQAPATRFETLALDRPSVGWHTLAFRNGVRYVFDAQGGDIKVPGQTARLARIEDPYGNGLTMRYDAQGRLAQVSDNLALAGRTGLSFAYDGQGRLGTVSDWSGRSWTYGYDAQGRLTSMRNPLGDTVRYGYEGEGHLLASITWPEPRAGGVERTRFAYYRNRRAFHYVNALGETETLDYDLYRKRTRVTHPRGFVRAYFYNGEGVLTKLTEPDGAVRLFAHTADGLRYEKTDGLGYSTGYSYRRDRGIDGRASDTGGNVSLERDALGQTVEYDYGVHDQLTRVVDKNAGVRQRHYYANTAIASGAVAGKLARETVMLDGEEVTWVAYTYTAQGNVKRQVTYLEPDNPSRQRHTDYTYTDNGLNVARVTVQGANGGQVLRTDYTYDPLGRRVSETVWRRRSAADATLIALRTQYEYDALDRVVMETHPRGDRRQTVYDANGAVIEERVHYAQADGRAVSRTVARHTYDAAGRRIRSTDIDGHSQSYGYDAGGNVIAHTDANGHTTRYEYDAMNRQTAVADANGRRTQRVYDLNGRLVRSTDANSHSTRYEYDALGRQTKIISALGHEREIRYDGNNNVTHRLDANATAGEGAVNAHGASEFNEYDALNRLIRQVNAQGGETRYEYDLLGNMTALTDAKGRTTRWIYDELGRVIEMIDPRVETPEDRTERYRYDEVGNRLTVTDRNGEVTRTDYDELNRPTVTAFLADGNTLTRTYDAYGDIISLSYGHVQYDYRYDRQHRMTRKTDRRSGRTMHWTYDAAGNLTTKTDYQGEVTEYQYDATHRLVALRNTAHVQVSYHYDAGGRLLNRILSNGARSDYHYDADNRLTRLTHLSADGTVVSDPRYTRDRVGHILTRTDGTGTDTTTTYTYDSQYRLTQVDAPGDAHDQSYTYDRVGNRLTHTTASGTAVYAYDDGNRLLTVRAGTADGPIQRAYRYDANSSRTERWAGALDTGTVTHRYRYNQQRLVTELITPRDVNRYSYDANGYRVAKHDRMGAHQYLLEGEHLEATYDGYGQLRAKYLRGVVVDELVHGYQYDAAGNASSATYHHDTVGSVTGLSGHAGAVTQTLTYGPFGAVQGQTGHSPNRLRYTGREQDADTGLYYYRARYYDPQDGRFLSEDPLGFAAGDVNFYVYVGNNPVNANDPSGLDARVNVDGNKVDIEIAVNYEGDGVNSRTKELVRQGIEKYWTGKFGKYNVTTRVTEGGWFDFSDNDVEIISGKGVSNVNRVGGDEMTLYTDTLDFSWVAAHEAGHMMGLKDRYIPYHVRTSRGRERTTTAVPGFENNIMGSYGRKGVREQDITDIINANKSTFQKTWERAQNFFIPSKESASVGAGGGFVLYPGRSNLNMLGQVYRK